MSTVDVAKILQPVPGDSPCGADLEYTPEFLALFQKALPKPARQVGAEEVPGEEPDWVAIKAEALAGLNLTKDLRLLVLLGRALVHTDGLAGFVDALRAMRGLVTSHWADLYPRLDSEDGNDPAMRVNALAGLTDGSGLVRSLREWPMLRARVAGRFGLRELEAASGRTPMSGTPPTPELVRAAFLEVGATALAETAALVKAAKEEVQGLEAALSAALGKSAISLRALTAVFDAMLRELAPHVGGVAAGTGDAPGAAAEAGASPAALGGGSAPAAVPGAIQSREDVVRTLDRICEFYARTEPSSPVPMLLQRARRLVDKSFLEVLRDLVPDGVNQAMIFQGPEQSS